MKTFNVFESTAGALFEVLIWIREASKGIVLGSNKALKDAKESKIEEEKRDRYTRDRSLFTVIAFVIFLVVCGLSYGFIPATYKVSAIQGLKPLYCENGVCNIIPSAERCDNMVGQVLSFWKDIQDFKSGSHVEDPQQFLEKILLTYDMLVEYISELSRSGRKIPIEITGSVLNAHEKMKNVNLDIVPNDLDEIELRRVLADQDIITQGLVIEPSLDSLMCWRVESFLPSENFCEGELFPERMFYRWGNDLEIGTEIAHIGWIEEFIYERIAIHSKILANVIRFLMGQTPSISFNAFKTFLAQVNQEIAYFPIEDASARVKGFTRTLFGGGISLLPCLFFAATIAYFPRLFCPVLDLIKTILMGMRGRILSRCKGNWVTDSILGLLIVSENISNLIWYSFMMFGITNMFGALASFFIFSSSFMQGMVTEGWIHSWNHILNVNVRSFSNFLENDGMWTQDPRVLMCFSLALSFLFGTYYTLGCIFRPLIDSNSIPRNPLMIFHEDTNTRNYGEEKKYWLCDGDEQIESQDSFRNAKPGDSIIRYGENRVVKNEIVYDYANACTFITKCAKWFMLAAQTVPIIVTTLLNAETDSAIGQIREIAFANGWLIEAIKENVKRSFPVIGQLNIGDDGLGYITSLLATYSTIPKNQIIGSI